MLLGAAGAEAGDSFPVLEALAGPPSWANAETAENGATLALMHKVAIATRRGLLNSRWKVVLCSFIETKRIPAKLPAPGGRRNMLIQFSGL
jgi:hypothetical protein